MAKKKLSDVPGKPLPEFFHPKDSTHGIVFRNELFLAVQPDCTRHTVHLSAGFSKMEMTIEVAKELRKLLTAAIRCAQGKDAGK